MMGAYWYLACDSLSRSATILADDFQQVTSFMLPKMIVFVSIISNLLSSFTFDVNLKLKIFKILVSFHISIEFQFIFHQKTIFIS